MEYVKSSPHYSPISEDPDSSFEENSQAGLRERLLPSLAGSVSKRAGGLGRALSQTWLLYINVALSVCSLILLVACVRIVSSRDGEDERNALLKKSSFYSPVFDRVDIPTRPVQFNGSLFRQDPPSIYRQSPSPEVDAAWRDISVLGAIGISAEDVDRVGKDSSKSVRAPESWGLGSNDHLAYIDVFHQIHCLDMLRKASHYDYYHRDDFGPEGPTNGYWAHLEHCTYMLLQTLKCHADVDVFTYTWVEGQDHPYPDFSANHQCRDFDALWSWAKKNQLDISKSRAFLKPAGTISQPAPGNFEGAADWAFEIAHGEFSEGWRKPV